MADTRKAEKSAVSPLERVKSETTPEHAVLRIKKRTRGWEPVPRALITDSRLQFDTRGFAAWLLARPPGWDIRVGVLPYLLKKERGPGEHIGRDKVRRFFRELECAGYVTRRRMRKADGRWLWRIEFTDTPPTKPGHPRTIDGSAVDGTTSGGTAVDGQGVDLLHTPNHPKLDKYKRTTTARPQNDTEGGADRLGDNLRYPDCLSREPVDSLRRLLAGCPFDMRQAVLDEVGAMHEIGKVRSPIGLLSALAGKAAVGQFSPNYSLKDDRLRTMASRRHGDRREEISRSESGEPVAVSELGRRVLPGLRERLNLGTLANDEETTDGPSSP
jgi:hypothetical protein